MKNKSSAATWFYSTSFHSSLPLADEIPCRGCNKVPATIGSFCAACRAAMGLK